MWAVQFSSAASVRRRSGCGARRGQKRGPKRARVAGRESPTAYGEMGVAYRMGLVRRIEAERALRGLERLRRPASAEQAEYAPP